MFCQGHVVETDTELLLVIGFYSKQKKVPSTSVSPYTLPCFLSLVMYALLFHYIIVGSQIEIKRYDSHLMSINISPPAI